MAHFNDCLNAGYDFVALAHAEDFAGYYVAMNSLDETHLLNITVAPKWQRKGYGRLLMGHLLASAIGRGVASIWLEVRPHNTAALALYQDWGFELVRRRKDYYPAAFGTREDALVMKLALDQLKEGAA
jgi:ribosomal-protein-alanine N-acetyltransferase